MKKRHLQNCLSKEKRIYESNVEEYKKIIKMECEDRVESIHIEPATKLESLAVISENCISEPSVVPRVSYSLQKEFEESLTQSSTSSLAKNADVLALLKEIAQGQKDIHTRLEKLEHNQANILQNQSILSNGQAAIVANQEQIANAIKKLEAGIVTKPEMMAQAKLLMECKVAIKRVELSVCRMTGETYDKHINEVASLLPLQTLAAVQEIEQKLKTPDFAQAMITYLHKLKGISEDVGSIIRAIFTDDLLYQYNWEGRWEKHSLAKLILVNKTLRDVFQGPIEFDKNVRKAVERSHNRIKQKKYLIKEKK